MVRKKKSVSPVCIAAPAAALVLYPLLFLQADPNLIRMIAAAAVTVVCILSSLSALHERGSLRRRSFFLAAAAATGILAGAVCALRVISVRAPLATLAPPEKITGLSGTLAGDPVPWGKELYRADLRTEACSTTATPGPSAKHPPIFSASGTCTVLLPAEMVREALPGGIARQNGRGTLFSAGLSLSLAGRFAPYDGQKGETFIVTAVTTGSEKWSSPAARFRALLRLSLMRVLHDWKDAGGFLLALLSANRDYLSSSLASDFRSAGLSHILALSGMHLSLLAMVTIKAGRRIGGKRFSIRLSIAAILFFVWFAGASPSLDRALLMALILAGTRALGFSGSILPVLAFTALLQLLADPADAPGLAFMLSYGALWGILTFGEALYSLGEGRVPGAVLSPLSASIGAQIMTTPVVALATGILTPAGIIASCIVSPLASVFLVAGLALVFLAVLVPPLAHLCGIILDVLYRSIEWPVRFFAAVPALKLEDLPQTVTAGILSLAAGFLIVYASAISKKRRSPDACFARL